MMTARSLRREGMNVRILERGELGQESTWAGGGILSPLYPWRYDDAINRLARYSHDRYPELARELQEASGIDPEFRKSGLLVMDPQEHAAGIDWSRRWRMPVEYLDAADFHQLEPGLSRPNDEVLHFPGIGQLRNPRLGKALAGGVKTLGIECHIHGEVNQLLQEHSRIRGVTTVSGETYYADQVVVAGGAWSPQLFPSDILAPDVAPVKGQMMIYRAEPETLHSIVLNQGRYLIPRKDGRILIGSTLENAGFDKTPTEVARQQLHQAAIRLLPDLENYAIEHHWAGLRPGTHNGIPYIGEHPEVSGLYLNTGHFRNGVILGLASAELLKNIMLDEVPIVDPIPYSLQSEH